MADEKNPQKITKKLDNIVMGVILGGAIGSVLGLTLAPRKGKETREIIKQKSGEMIEKGKDMVERGRDLSEQFVKDHHETIESAKFHLKKRKGFFRWLKSLLWGSKTTAGKSDKPVPDESDGEK